MAKRLGALRKKRAKAIAKAYKETGKGSRRKSSIKVSKAAKARRINLWS